MTKEQTALWLLADPDKAIAALLSSTNPRHIETLTLPVLQYPPGAGRNAPRLNYGAYWWNLFQRNNGARFSRIMEEWFLDLNARNKWPEVKIIKILNVKLDRETINEMKRAAFEAEDNIGVFFVNRLVDRHKPQVPVRLQPQA